MKQVIFYCPFIIPMFLMLVGKTGVPGGKPTRAWGECADSTHK